MRLIGWFLFLGVGALFVWFALNNWAPVTVNLSGDAYVQPALPVLVLAALLAGFVPTWAMHRLSRFLMARKLTKANKRIADLLTEVGGPKASASADSSEAAILARSQAAGWAGGYEELTSAPSQAKR